MPKEILKHLWENTVMKGRAWTWSLLNLTPWEGQFEKALM
jgi:hypothetical protein